MGGPEQRVGWLTRGSVDGVSSLICAGWLPQDGCFGWNGSRCLKDERHPCEGAAHRNVADSFRALPSANQSALPGTCRAYSVMAKDQHQPAISRAIATTATLLFFFRFSNCAQRWCSRRLPASPRSLAAAGARSHRARMVVPAL